MIDTQSATTTQAEMKNIDAFNQKLQQNNYWVMAAGIGAPATAKLIDNRQAKAVIEGRSNFAGLEFYSGFWIIDVPTNELAAELALEGSGACNRKVELRPFLN